MGPPLTADRLNEMRAETLGYGGHPLTPAPHSVQVPGDHDRYMSLAYPSLPTARRALAAWGLWYGEVFWINGASLWAFNWSALPICLMIAGVSSYAVAAQAPWRGRAFFILSGFGLSLTAFLIARKALLQFFNVGMGPMRMPDFRLPIVVIFVGFVLCMGLVIAARRWLAPMRRWTAGLVFAALILVLLLSFWGRTSDPETARAVKLGYPVFWAAFLVPLALAAGRVSDKSRPGDK